MNYITVQEYAELKGISRQAVMKAIKQGKLAAEHRPDDSQPKGKWFVFSDATKADATDATRVDATTTFDATHATDATDATTTLKTPISDATHDNHIAEPSIMVEEPTQVPEDSDPPLHPLDFSTSRPLDSTPPLSQAKPLSEEYVPYHRMSEAQLFALLMEAIDTRISDATAKSQEWQSITHDFNSRSLVPELHKLKGHRSERALRLWFQKWQQSGNDMFALVHQNVNHTRGRKVTLIEQNYLLSKLLCDSKPSVASAISDLKSAAELGIIESPTSPPTLKRWVSDWEHANPAQWAQARHGSKYVKDTIVKSIMRDTSMLEVGDVLVADGHVLANSIINPITGKPGRMTLIMFYDWASRYPVGASLVMTESSAHILTAVRNAIMQLGFMPRYIYFDNGKAFKSKLFHANWEDHDLSVELAGIFPRLGIKAEFAEAYNARSKVIERFFRTMQEQFERFQSAFRGRNIDDKPANLSRNEKWAQKLFTGKPMEYDEALDLAYYYFRHIYGMREHAGIGNQKPYEVFAARAIDPARVIEPERLNFLLLKAERKQLRSEGIWLNKCRYYDEDMINHIGNPVIIRYDYSDLRWIFVYDLRGVFICQAALREAKHGFVYMSENPLAHQELIAEIKQNKRLLRTIERSTAELIKSSTRAVEAELAKHRAIQDGIMEDIKESNPTFRQPPIIKAPAKKQDIAQEIAALERLARTVEQDADPANLPGEGSPSEAPSKLITLESLMEEDTPPESTTYPEMLKRIGIK